MPAADSPCFHWRPSTARTFFCPSCSIRQTPTTLKKDFGSAPTVSFAKSILVGCCAAAGNTKVENPKTEMPMVPTILLMFMTDLRLCWTAIDVRGAAAPPPEETDQQWKPAEKPRERDLTARDQGVSRIVVSGYGSRQGHVREPVEQRENFPWTGGAASV